MSLISAVTGGVIPNANGSSFPITPELTAIAVSYSNPAVTMIADQVMPLTPDIGVKEFKWTQYDVGNEFTVPDLSIGPRSEPNTYEVPGKEINDKCIDYGLQAFIPNDDIKQSAALRAINQSIIDPQFLNTETLTNVVKLGRERRVANITFNPANYVPSQTEDLSQELGAQQFDNFATSDPIEIITNYLDGCLIRPNTLVFGQSAWSALRRNPRIMMAVNRDAGSTGLATRQDIADQFEVNQILVGASRVNLSLNRTNPTLARTWGPHCAGLFIDPQAAKSRGLTWGFTANYRGLVAGAIPDNRTGVDGGVWVRVVQTVKEIIAAPGVGFLLTNCVSRIPTGQLQQN